jgi:DNA repair protein RecN (Recombination protein N)
MLKYLKIQNFLIIENQELYFHDNFNVIIGETGSGKSIILKALSFVLGNRIDQKVIRSGCDKATITAEFDISNHKQSLSLLDEFELENKQSIILRRVIKKDASSKIFLNDQIVSNQIIKKVFVNLLEIQTQNEKNNLYDNKYILNLIDNFHGNSSLVNEVNTLFKSLAESRLYLSELHDKAKKIIIEKQYYNQIIDDLDSFNPNLEDYNNVENNLKNIKESSNFQTSLKHLSENFNSERGILSLLNDSIRELNSLTEYKAEFVDKISTEFANQFDILSSISDQIEDELYDISSNQFNEEELKDRFSNYKSFARKYRVTESELELTLQDAKERLKLLENLDSEIVKTENLINEKTKSFLTEAGKLSKIRQQSAKTIEKDIKTHLSELNMSKADINVKFNTLSESTWNNSGLDNIKFLITTNPGQPFTELKNTISGGEMSRVLLAIKLCFNAKLGLNTIIFDEIDAGIGGKTAELIAKKLENLSKSVQIIAITHNEIISKNANKKLTIAKEHVNGNTFSYVKIA